MKVLFIGDISGSSGRDIVKKLLPELRKERDIDIVIANGENAAGGLGITRPTAIEIFSSGVDIITLGNHTFKKHDVAAYLDEEPMILRPANYPKGDPGRGFITTEVGGYKIGVISLQGQVFMEPMNSPFEAADDIVDDMRKETSVIFVDFHAEATSEKMALGWYLDGRVTAVLGTHTHVQTADERTLPNGCAFMTDAGMTGVQDSILGLDVEMALSKFLTKVPSKFLLASGGSFLHGALVEVDYASGRATHIERIKAGLNP